MELSLEINESMILKVSLSGEASAYVPLDGARLQAATPVTERQSAPATGKRRGRPARKERVAAPPSETEQIAQTRHVQPPAPAAAMEDPKALPAELSHLPKKHQDFYSRKLSEYLEVYPVNKARDLAIQAVRSIAGEGPKR